jgi:hypothetical protein
MMRQRRGSALEAFRARPPRPSPRSRRGSSSQMRSSMCAQRRSKGKCRARWPQGTPPHRVRPGRLVPGGPRATARGPENDDEVECCAFDTAVDVSGGRTPDDADGGRGSRDAEPLQRQARLLDLDGRYVAHNFVPKALRSAEYRKGRLVLFLTWDEDSGNDVTSASSNRLEVARSSPPRLLGRRSSWTRRGRSRRRSGRVHSAPRPRRSRLASNDGSATV